jgi:muramoyltetrapeptide carboxypeptidase
MAAAQTRPQRLKHGARIGIVSPSYWLEAERLQRAAAVFEGLGYQLVLGKSTGLKQDKYAGDPQARADDIMVMFEDPAIDAIVCARGGYGGNRVLPLLDYGSIGENPKIFCGYSDVTAYLNSMARRSGLVTFHGPMLTTYTSRAESYNLDTFQKVLSGSDRIRIDDAPACPARVLKPGTARGALWGGNLSLVVERLGTPEQLELDGAILLLEEIDEKPHAFDRMLLQLRNSGTVERVRGLLLGEMLEMTENGEPFGKSTDEIVLDVFGDLDIPILSNFPCGHGRFQATLPISHEVELHATGEKPHILIPESPVS